MTRPVLPLLSSHRSTSNQPSALGHRSPVSSPRDSPNLWTDRFHGLVLEAWRLGQCPWVQQQRKIPCLRLYSRDARRRPSSCGCRSGSRCSNGTRRLLGTTSSAWVIQVFDGEVALRGVEAMAAGLAVLANRGWVSIGQGGEVAAELLEQECGSVEAVGGPLTQRGLCHPRRCGSLRRESRQTRQRRRMERRRSSWTRQRACLLWPGLRRTREPSQRDWLRASPRADSCPATGLQTCRLS